tara:strand:- start:251 stop:1249 length:999 start_codon:yes stop_codon:yes gene_type:complete
MNSNSYLAIKNQSFIIDKYMITPIRLKDRFKIMRWRNEQLYHLRQKKKITKKDQELYFKDVVNPLFKTKKPNQILFSFLENQKCIGYGGLVHIDWGLKKAEISFVMKTSLEEKSFSLYWTAFLKLIEIVAFKEMEFKSVFTFSFNMRPNLYLVLKKEGYFLTEVQKEAYFFQDKSYDVLIHNKTKSFYETNLKEASFEDSKLLYNWRNDNKVIKNSISNKSVSFDEHEKWFKKIFFSNKTLIFIAYLKKQPIGQIRLTHDDKFWKIDYSIDKSHRGNSYGVILIKKILQMGKFHLKAEVKLKNKASLTIFRKLNFAETFDADNSLAVFTYEK